MCARRRHGFRGIGLDLNQVRLFVKMEATVSDEGNRMNPQANVSVLAGDSQPPPTATPLCTRSVSFRFHARSLAALGRDLVTDDVVALMELVKNSYDAMATRVFVRICLSTSDTRSHYIEIADDGHGMDYDTITNVWCVIATPFRRDSAKSAMQGRSRAVTGEKGLGRLSAARLGEELQVTTKTEGDDPLQFSLKWSELLTADDLVHRPFEVAALRPEEFDEHQGTLIRIDGLRSDWSDVKIDDLREHLARLVSPFSKQEDFALHLDLVGRDEQANPVRIESPPFLAKPKYAITGTVTSSGTILATYRHRPIGGSDSRKKTIHEEWPAIYDGLSEHDRSGLDRSSPACGEFDFEIRAWDLTKNDTRDIEKHFRENRRHIRGAIRSQRGVSIYRDDVLVLPKSDGARDWLDLDLRRVSRVGVRLSTNQVVGYVRITRSGNPRVQDTSDREGLVSNAATMAFRHLTRRIVALLEVERHSDRLKESDTGTASDLFANLSAAPLVERLTELQEKGGDFNEAVETVKEFGSELERSRANIQRRFGYYNRLAVIGTISQMVIHEIRNRTTVIGRGLRKAGELAEHVRDKATGSAINMATRSVTALEALADRFAPLASRGYRPSRRTSVVQESIDRCLEMHAAVIRSIGVEVETQAPSRRTEVGIDPAEIDAIMLNIVGNSLYWLQRQRGRLRLRFRLISHAETERVTVCVDDSGPGIEPQDKDRVFWPGITRKPDGIGMGLTVASELVDGHGGKMRTIVPGELGGATFEFDLPPASERKKGD